MYDLDYLRYPISGECLLGNDCRAGAFLNLSGQLGYRIYGSTGQLAPFQKPCDQITVPAGWGKDDGAVIRRFAVTHRRAVHLRYWMCLQGIAVLR